MKIVLVMMLVILAACTQVVYTDRNVTVIETVPVQCVVTFDIAQHVLEEYYYENVRHCTTFTTIEGCHHGLNEGFCTWMGE